jgi:hypothetical protein
MTMKMINPMSSRPPTPPPSGVDTRSRVRIGDDGFVSDAVLDAWMRAGEVVRAGAVLSVRDGRRFLLQDALRILGLRNGEVDLYGVTGRVDAIRNLLRQGALLSSDGVRIGSAIYDVEYGVLAFPFASPDESGANAKVF